MGDLRLQALPSRHGRLTSVCNDIDESNSVQANDLFKVHIAFFISVDVFDGQAEISSVRVGLENIAPIGSDWRFRHSHVEEERVGIRFKYSICLDPIH